MISMTTLSVLNNVPWCVRSELNTSTHGEHGFLPSALLLTFLLALSLSLSQDDT